MCHINVYNLRDLKCRSDSEGLCLLQGHPYRNVLDLRHGASTSLIELEFASHTGKDSDTDPGVPTGLPFYTLKAQLRELELVFLNRFMQVCVPDLDLEETPPLPIDAAHAYVGCFAS